MRWIYCAIALGFSLSVLAGVTASPPKLTAAQIVDRNVAARGGLDAWRKVQSMVWIGHLESEHAPLPSMGFVLEQKRPNMTRFQLIAMNERTVRAVDGRQGWKARPGNVEPYTLQELRFAQAAPGLDGPLIDYKAKGNLVELRGLEEIEGRAAWHLNVRLASGERDDVWIDTHTFLELRYDRATVGANGLPARPVSVIYRDFKKIDGMMVPSLVETGAGSGSVPDKMVVERIVLNAPLDDQAFGRPGAANPRRAGRKSSP